MKYQYQKNLFKMSFIFLYTGMSLESWMLRYVPVPVTKKKISNFSVSHIVVKMLYAGVETEVIDKVKSEPHKNLQTLDILLSHSKIIFYLFKYCTV
jgi:hypothetical protein